MTTPDDDTAERTATERHPRTPHRRGDQARPQSEPPEHPEAGHVTPVERWIREVKTGHRPAPEIPERLEP